MLQFSKVLASLCAGCLCTLTIHQIPAGQCSAAPDPRHPRNFPDSPGGCDAAGTPADAGGDCSGDVHTAYGDTVTADADNCRRGNRSHCSDRHSHYYNTLPETTAATESETTVAVTSTIPESDPFFQEHETWFKAYMDYRTITDTDSVQYAMEQNAWTDDRGLRRMADDYLVAMGTGWLESGCGERFAVTLENGSEFTVRVGDIKADQHTDKTHRYRSCESGANVLEFIVDTGMLSGEARNAGTVSVYPELSGNITAIVPAE